jgi:hypothetical protein
VNQWVTPVNVSARGVPHLVSGEENHGSPYLSTIIVSPPVFICVDLRLSAANTSFAEVPPPNLKKNGPQINADGRR